MTRRLRIEDLTTFAVPESPALAPDGSRIAYVLRTVDAESDKTCRAVWLVDADAREPRQLTRGTSDTSPAWSPDGTTLAFLRAQDGPAQLWLLPVDGGEPVQITTLPLGAGEPRWSPDGTRIAFSAPVDRAAPLGPDGVPGSAEDPVSRARRAKAPVVTERLDYAVDGVGLLRAIRRHLHVLDVASLSCRQITDGDWHAGDPAWSPDGTRLAFGAAVAPDSDLRTRMPAHIVTLTGDERTPREVALRDGVARAISWAPDGAALVVAGTQHGPGGHTRLLLVPPDGGPATNLAGTLDRNVAAGGQGYPGPPQLHDGGRRVLFGASVGGCSHLFTASLSGDGEVEDVLTGPGRSVTGMSVAGNAAAIVLRTPTSFGEIVLVNLAERTEAVCTQHGQSYADIELFERVERHFSISDGTVVDGWLIRDPQRRTPMPLLLDIHGGPHGAWNGAADDVNLHQQELAARGWAVLLINPRASDGYSEEFFNGAVGAWGVADAPDLLEPVDQLVAEGLADPQHLALAGYSYGGYLVCYLTSRDSRFAAAVTGGVVSDLSSMVGTSDAGHFISEYELGGPPWAAGSNYEHTSPLARVADVQTPTLILQGAADLRCPLGQAQQWHTALRERNVPTELVLYPEASHLFIVNGLPSHRMDWCRRIADWADRHAGHPDETAAAERPGKDDQGQG